MRHFSVAAVALLVLALPTPTLADRASLTIADVHVTFADPAGQTRRVDLGDITVTLANRTGSGMSGVFRVTPSLQPPDAGPSLWDHLEIHWVNIITKDDCPATVAGAPAGSRRLPFPVVDMPRHGWDYVYRSRGRRVPERTESNADGRELRDDARDIWPWYHTPEEEAMEPDSGNGGGGFGQFRRGVTYGIRDLPSLCSGGGLTAFTTILVAVVPASAAPVQLTHDAPVHLPLQPGQLLVLAGFDWDWSSRSIRLEETPFTLDDFNRALHNSSFPEWHAVENLHIHIPSLDLLEPTRGTPAPRRPNGDRPAPARPVKPSLLKSA